MLYDYKIIDSVLPVPVAEQGVRQRIADVVLPELLHNLKNKFYVWLNQSELLKCNYYYLK